MIFMTWWLLNSFDHLHCWINLWNQIPAFKSNLAIHQEPGSVRGKLPWTGMASGGSQSGLPTGGSRVDAWMEAVCSSPAWTIFRISTQAGVCWRFGPFKWRAGPLEFCFRRLHRDLTNVIFEYCSNECVNIFMTWSLLSAWLWHQDSWRILFRGISVKH